MRTIELSADEVRRNREFYLAELRSGKYQKGTTRSDERGIPIVESEADEGCCACALMCDLFLDFNGVESDRNYLIALDLTPEQCRFIQRDLNDTDLTFEQIADRIEAEVFNGG